MHHISGNTDDIMKHSEQRIIIYIYIDVCHVTIYVIIIRLECST